MQLSCLKIEYLSKKTLIAVAALGLVLAGSAQSAIIGNGPPNQTGGSDLNAFLEADDFSLGSSALINQVKYWTLQDTAADYVGTTFWAFYTNAAGVPGSAIASGTTAATGVATGNTTLGLKEFAYTFNTNVLLNAGNYWLVLHNGPSNVIPATNYNWAWSKDTGNSQNRDLSVPGSPWVTNSAELAFQLSAVPEPGSIFLLGGGLLAGWLVRRKLIPVR